MTLYTIKTVLQNASKEDLEALTSKWAGPRDEAQERIAGAILKALEEEAQKQPSHAVHGAPSSGGMMGKSAI